MFNIQSPPMMQENVESEKIELYFQCKNLRDMDVFSKSDPQLVVFSSTSRTGQASSGWNEIWKSEKIDNNLNPIFSKTLETDYVFERTQNLMVEVRDIDSSSSFELIGRAEFEIGELMGSRNNIVVLQLYDNSQKQTGKCLIRGEACQKGNKEKVVLGWSCQKLDFSRWCCMAGSPFLVFYKPQITPQVKRQMESDQFNIKNCTWVKVHATEHYTSTEKPKFKPFSLTSSKLCSGDYNLPLKCEFWHFTYNGSHDMKGETTFTINSLKNGANEFTFRNQAKGGKECGKLYLNYQNFLPDYSFSDYLRGGLGISTRVFIDFTGSNRMYFPQNLKK
jgi:hypothetical protein